MVGLLAVIPVARAQDFPEAEHQAESTPSDENHAPPVFRMDAPNDLSLSTPTIKTPTDATPAVTPDKPAPADAAAASSDDARRIQMFLIPIGEDPGLFVAQTQIALEAEVNRMPGFHPVDLVAELAVPPPPEVLAKAAEARHAVEDGNIQLGEHQYVEAANRYGHALEFLSDAAIATTALEMAELYVRHGVALQYSGEDEKAHEEFRAAARMDLGRQLDVSKIDADASAALLNARRELGRGGAAGLSVITDPPGARVFIGGVYRGTSPLSIERLPVGLNFVRIDRPGATPYARLVEVKLNEDTPVRAKMTFTQETVELQNMLQQIPTTLDKDKLLPDMVRSLGRRFRLRRVVIATLQMARRDRANVRLAVFDMAREVRLADEHAVFAADDTLRDEVSKWGRAVFDRADGSRNRAAADPLQRSDGTEDWYADKFKPKPGEAAAAAPAADTTAAAPADSSPPAVQSADPPPPPADPPPKKAKTKKRGLDGDPLKGEDGTDDW
jgi:hypothetical protein